ncbi:hypothetical protein ACJMK2_021178 [Sinanodonta woodiana]|uniref:FAD synthase n=1 Tax=Sinanodonta woodiana TaxID=1069815 RepID=A0ABD3U1B1_SINWO
MLTRLGRPFMSTRQLHHANRLIVVHRHLSSSYDTELYKPMNNHTAGLIVIGDEILKGQTADTNSFFICKHLHSWGVRVKRISVIPDDLDTIASEVAHFSSQYTHVITSGGIGPTHDDLTFEGVAKAFGENVEPHPVLVDLCKQHFGTDDLNSPELKMAKVPKSAKLVFGEDKKTGAKTKYPLVTVKNVYLFPGVPSILEKAFVLLKDLFQNPYAEFHTREVYIQHDEVSITHILNTVNAAYSKDVVMGSYPNFKSSYYKVKVTLESENKNRLEEAHTALIKALPEGSIVKYEKDPIASAIKQVHDIVESDDQSKYTCNVRKAVQVIEECLERYSLDEICVGFNGGKDCTVLLHLFHAAKMRKFPTCTQKTKCLYIKSRSPFPEVEKFIQITRDNYKLDMLNFSGRIKESLGELQKQHPEIKSVIMGTRVTDPYSAHLEAFSMTDSDWPQFMRVNPLLDWSYNDVWKFLRSLCLPYCSLYDRGYTSLGCMNNTHPNPSLQYIDERGVVCYKPAYELELESQERDGRN